MRNRDGGMQGGGPPGMRGGPNDRKKSSRGPYQTSEDGWTPVQPSKVSQRSNNLDRIDTHKIASLAQSSARRVSWISTLTYCYLVPQKSICDRVTSGYLCIQTFFLFSKIGYLKMFTGWRWNFTRTAFWFNLGSWQWQHETLKNKRGACFRHQQ